MRVLDKENTTKARKRNGNAVKEAGPTNATGGIPSSLEEIRQRAHSIFMARGWTPGNELDDWLRAEQELKQERAGPNTGTTR
jgi:hypothetical protein